MTSLRQMSRISTPHWCGLSEVPYAGAMSFTCPDDIAQWVEHQTHTLRVVGSTPTIDTIGSLTRIPLKQDYQGRLAR